VLKWARQQRRGEGELLIRSGDPVDRIYLLLESSISIER